jgi:protoporphyrinogen oxidase
MPEIVILGGGLSGIACAYELAKRNIPCLLLEAAPELGGLSAIYDAGSYKIEKTYHAFFRGDKAMLDLLAELGLSDQVVWREVKIGYLVDGRIQSFATPLDILLNRRLSIWDKAKLVWLTLKMSTMNEWRHLDKITAKSWILSNGTRRLYEQLFEPILHVKWNDFKEKISAAWIWGRIYPRAKSRTKGGVDKCGYLLGSYDVALKRMTELAEKKGSRLITSASCTKVSIENDKVKSITYRQDNLETTIEEPIVISTIQPPNLLKIAEGLPRKFSDSLARIKYEGVICILGALKKPLTDFGQVPIAPGQVRFGGIVEWGNFVPASFFSGDHLVYLFTYLPTTHPDWKLAENEIKEAYFSDIKKIIPSFSIDDVKWSIVFKDAFGTPIFETGYLSYMPEAISPVKGLYLAGMFNTYPVTDFNKSLLLAQEIASHIDANRDAAKSSS